MPGDALPVGDQLYTDEFFANQAPGSRQSAVETVPLLLRWVAVGSVVDVGCGIGTWLSVFREHGITDTLGLDGRYIDPDLLLIPPATFRAADLTAPPALGRTFDLAISLEVAEHLPAAAADALVTYLTSLAPVVLFSAAVPGQGGVDHVNEQWPDYWAARFRRLDFLAIDCLRPLLWQNERVQWWYAQNILLLAHTAYVDKAPVLQAMAERTELARLALVHPRAYEAARRENQELQRRLRPENLSLRETLRVLPGLVRAAIRRRIG